MHVPFLPKSADNAYYGQPLALALFALLVFVKTGICLVSILNGHDAAGSADAIPLDTFGPAGARAVISIFALLGLSQLVTCLVCALVLLRYRSLVPLMFALLLLELLGRRVVLHFLPIARSGAATGTMINQVILAAMVVGLALSLWRRAAPANARGR